MQRLSSLPRLLRPHHPPPRPFSAAGPDTPDTQDPSPDPFLEPPTKGLVYGKLTGIGRHMLKTDVIHFLEGCNLKTEDIKVDYNRIYAALGMLLQFPSHANFDMAARLITRKGRLYKFGKVGRAVWDQGQSFDGKALLLQGIPRPATVEDIERLLSGCEFDASSISMFFRPGQIDPIKMALVHFPSQIEAMNAFRVKNRGFCLNNSITMRVLQ